MSDKRAEIREVSERQSPFQPAVVQTNVEPSRAVDVRHDMEVEEGLISLVQTRQQGYVLTLAPYRINLPSDSLFPRPY